VFACACVMMSGYVSACMWECGG